MLTDEGSIGDFSSRLNKLSDLLGGAASDSRHASRRSAPPQPQRPATSSVLRSANIYAARDAPLGGLLQRYRDAEAGWLKEKGKLMLAVEGEKKRRLKVEAELRRVQQQLSYRVGQADHLKQALKGRDCELHELRDRLRDYELAEGGERTSQETVAEAQAERDELREVIDALLQRLDAANEMIERSSSNVANLEAQLAAVAAERQQAQEAAGAAQAEAQQLQEALADMQWKCGLLQQLSDLTLQQNEDKAATLQTLLETESMLDAAGVEASGDGSDDDAGIC